MDEEFIPYGEALALKELGFGASPIGSTHGGSVFYYEKGKLYYDGQPMYSSCYHEGQILAPLYQQAFRWFREKYGLNSWIESLQGRHTAKIVNHYSSTKYVRYGEAELDCLIELIKIVKENKL